MDRFVDLGRGLLLVVVGVSAACHLSSREALDGLLIHRVHQ
jgi:hypothetical protein